MVALLASWSAPVTIAGTLGNHNGPSSAMYPVASQMVDKYNLAFATGVGYSSLLYYTCYSFSGGSWASLSNLSSALPSYYQQQRNPTVATSTSSTSTCHVAWEAFNMQQATAVIVHRKGSSGNFGSQYSIINYLSASKPSITGLTSDNAWLLFQNSAGGGLTKAPYSFNGSVWVWGTPAQASPSGSYPQLSVGSSGARYLWTSGTSSPYSISLGSESLSKGNLRVLDYSRELNLIDPGTGSSLTLEIEEPHLIHKDGTISLISFVEAPAESILIVPKDVLTYGGTKPFVFSSTTDTLKFHCTIRTINSSDVLQDTNATLSITLVHLKSGKTISTICTQSLAKSSNSTPRSCEIAIAAGGIANVSIGSDVVMNASLSGILQKSPDLSASLGHIYRIGEEGTAELAKRTVAEDMIPREYILQQNYPNPFNPSTTIRYGLPSGTHVTLSVFNALGQQTAILQNGEMGAGYHEVQFNAANLPSGVYFYRLLTESFTATKKLLLVR